MNTEREYRADDKGILRLRENDPKQAEIERLKLRVVALEKAGLQGVEAYEKLQETLGGMLQVQFVLVKRLAGSVTIQRSDLESITEVDVMHQEFLDPDSPQDGFRLTLRGPGEH